MLLFSTDQIREICILARQAYEAWELREQHEDRYHALTKTKTFDLWRHQETAKVTGGETSLRRCISDRHYLPLLAHFADLAGEGGRALKLLLRHGEAGRIRAYFKLVQAQAERGLAPGYAESIAARQYKCALGDCSEKQLWSLFFTVRNRRKVAAPAAQRPVPRRVREKLGTLAAVGDGNPF